MPVEVRQISFGAPPTRTITRGPRKGQQVPKFEVVLPGWDDIIHVTPTASLTAEEQREQRERMFRGLRGSATPQVVRDFSKIGQQIDNVQDALVTLSVAGRILTKVAGRAIPGLGTITTLADVLNILNVFYPKSARQAVTGAVSRAGARLSGRKKYLASKELKRTFGLGSKGDLSTYLRRLEETVKTGKVGFGFGEALQIAQTSEELTGYGVSLGPIFGAVQDSVFGFLRGARFDISGPLGLTGRPLTAEQLEAMRKHAPGEYQLKTLRDPATRARVVIDWPGVFPSLDRLMGRAEGLNEARVAALLSPLLPPAEKAATLALSGIATAQRAVVSASGAVWNAGRWLAGVRGDLTWEDHIELLCAQWLALDSYEPWLQQTDWGEVAGRVALDPYPEDLNSSTGLLERRSRGEAAAELLNGGARAPFEWVEEAPTPLARSFTVALIESFAEKLLLDLEGPQAKIEERSSDSFRALRLLHDYNLLPPYERTDGEVSTFLDGVLAGIAGNGGDVPSYGVVAELWRSSFPGGDPSE